MALKSEIIRPQNGEMLGLGTTRVFGLAWAGEQSVARVDISTDCGITWQPAELIGPQAAYSWSLWEYLWEIDEPGEYSILARATAANGDVQPEEHDLLCGGYLIHDSRPTNVKVAESQRSQEQRADFETMLYDMNAFAEANTQFPLDVEMEFAGGEGI